MKKSFSIGLDLGGTKLAAALVDSKGHIIDKVKVPVGFQNQESPAQSQRRVLKLMTDLVLDFQKRFPTETKKFFAGVGLASAGPLNVATGTLENPVNFPGWKRVAIRDLLQEKLKQSKIKSPVYFQNDAIAAALAEGWCGAAQGLQSYAVVTVGTGIGTGVIFQNLPCQTLGMGSEFGHLVVDGMTLKKDLNLHPHTVEGIASGTGLLRRARALGFQGNSVEELVLEMQTASKYAGLFEDMSWALAVLWYNLSIGFRLEKILVSGGLIKIKDLFMPKALHSYKTLVEQMNVKFKAPVQIAKTQNHAGVLGAAYLPYLSKRTVRSGG